MLIPQLSGPIAVAENSNRVGATRKWVWNWVAVACLAAVNVAGLLLFGQIKIDLGTPPFRVQEFALLGICTGHLCLLIFAMSFGHLRGPVRHAVCSILIIASLWSGYRGLHEFRLALRRAAADGELLPYLQVGYLGALWVGFVLLIPVRMFGRLEFGFLHEGFTLPARSTQFRLHTMLYFSILVAVAAALVRFLIVIWNDANPNQQLTLQMAAVPLAMLVAFIAATLPLLITSFSRRRSFIGFPLALAWTAIPILPIELATGLYVTAFYIGCVATVAVNLIALRLLGFRWLAVAEPAAAVVGIG